jgi:hypothetical protein
VRRWYARSKASPPTNTRTRSPRSASSGKSNSSSRPAAAVLDASSSRSSLLVRAADLSVGSLFDLDKRRHATRVEIEMVQGNPAVMLRLDRSFLFDKQRVRAARVFASQYLRVLGNQVLHDTLTSVGLSVIAM